MKAANLVSLVLTLSGITLASAQAPTESSHRRARANRTLSPIVRALDANQDGEISLSEIRIAGASLRLLDTNADGTLSFAELHPGMSGDADSGAISRPLSIDPVLLALDADRDGELSPFEVAAAVTRLLVLDGNEDGKLARVEMRTLPTASTE